MERLTEKHFGADDHYMKCSEFCANDAEMCGGCPELEKIVNRLAAYEDTGLTPKDVVDLMGNHGMALGELAKHFVQVEPTILHIHGDVPTVYGYNVNHLALIAEMLRKQLITEDEMTEVFNDFEKMYHIVCQAHHTELKEKALGFVYETVYPSALDVATQMQKLDHLKEVKATVKERPWNDLREHSGLVEED